MATDRMTFTTHQHVSFGVFNLRWMAHPTLDLRHKFGMNCPVNPYRSSIIISLAHIFSQHAEGRLFYCHLTTVTVCKPSLSCISLPVNSVFLFQDTKSTKIILCNCMSLLCESFPLLTVNSKGNGTTAASEANLLDTIIYPRTPRLCVHY